MTRRSRNCHGSGGNPAVVVHIVHSRPSDHIGHNFLFSPHWIRSGELRRCTDTLSCVHSSD